MEESHWHPEREHPGPCEGVSEKPGGQHAWWTEQRGECWRKNSRAGPRLDHQVLEVTVRPKQEESAQGAVGRGTT